MPTYDYECTSCSKPVRAQHSMNDPRPDCPECGGELKQVFLMAPALKGANGKDFSDAPCGDAPASACSTGGCPFQS